VLCCVVLQIGDDGQNEFVKNYLKQREQLMSEMDQKKGCEGADCGLSSIYPSHWIRNYSSCFQALKFN